MTTNPKQPLVKLHPDTLEYIKKGYEVENEHKTAAIVVIYYYTEKNGPMVLSFKRKDNNLGFIGGKVEQDETPQETAVRETFEEAGIYLQNADRPQYVDTMQNRGTTVYCYSHLLKTEEDYLFAVDASTAHSTDEGKCEFVEPYDFLKKPSEYRNFNILLLNKLNLI